jgi:hypothetical protein
MILNFPADPQTNAQYVAENNIVYIWTGDRWSSTLAVQTAAASYVLDGEYAASQYDPQLDQELDGGGA